MRTAQRFIIANPFLRSLCSTHSTLDALFAGLDVPKLVNADGEWAVHPDDKDYQRWFMLTLLLVVYNSVMLPFDLMFYNLPERKSTSASFTFWLDTLIDFTFLLDLWITFRVGFIDDNEGGNLCVSRSKIKNRYIWKGTFFIDLVSR